VGILATTRSCREVLPVAPSVGLTLDQALSDPAIWEWVRSTAVRLRLELSGRHTSILVDSVAVRSAVDRSGGSTLLVEVSGVDTSQVLRWRPEPLPVDKSDGP
jgi:hypothetical protein